MDKFKQKIRYLEEKVQELDNSLKTIQGVPTERLSNETHYQCMNSEQGEVVLDEFDTFRYLRVGKKEIRNICHYSEFGGNGTIGTKEKNMYILQNVPQDVLEYIKALQNKVFYQTDSLKLAGNYHVAFHIDDEEHWDITKAEMYVIYLHSTTNDITHISTDSKTLSIGATYFPMSKEIKNILDFKAEECSDFKTVLDNGKYKFIGDFSQYITVDFKNNYKILPHVSFYLTPIGNSKITCAIKSLTKKYVIFEMKYGFDAEDIHTSGCLHWKVDGIVVNDNISLLD